VHIARRIGRESVSLEVTRKVCENVREGRVEFMVRETPAARKKKKAGASPETSELPHDKKRQPRECLASDKGELQPQSVAYVRRAG